MQNIIFVGGTLFLPANSPPRRSRRRAGRSYTRHREQAVRPSPATVGEPPAAQMLLAVMLDGQRYMDKSQFRSVVYEILLAAAGSALGGAVGGSVAGLGAMALGKAAGAVIGSAIDQRLLGPGSAPVETGRVERLPGDGIERGRGAGAGLRAEPGGGAGDLVEPVSRVGPFRARRRQGRRAPACASTAIRSASRIALCEGEVSRIGRIWADGQAIDQSGVSFRLHRGHARISCPTR